MRRARTVARMDRSRRFRVAREVATLVWMVVSLDLLVVATRQIFTGIGMAFVIEPTNAEREAAYAGLAMIDAAYWYIVLAAVVAVALVHRRWWVWLSIGAPVLIFLVCGIFIPRDAAALISFVGLVTASIAAISEIAFCVVRAVQAVREPLPVVQPD